MLLFSVNGNFCLQVFCWFHKDCIVLEFWYSFRIFFPFVFFCDRWYKNQVNLMCWLCQISMVISWGKLRWFSRKLAGSQQLNSSPNYYSFIWSKSTVMVVFFFLNYLSPRINFYLILIFILWRWSLGTTYEPPLLPVNPWVCHEFVRSLVVAGMGLVYSGPQREQLVKYF